MKGLVNPRVIPTPFVYKTGGSTAKFWVTLPPFLKRSCPAGRALARHRVSPRSAWRVRTQQSRQAKHLLNQTFLGLFSEQVRGEDFWKISSGELAGESMVGGMSCRAGLR